MSEKRVEANALTPKTTEERQSWISLAFVQAGICVCVPSFLEGALLAEEMPFAQAIAAGVVGNIIVVVLMSILGFIGADLGRASCTLAESTFGTKGARYIISIVYAINLIGWFGINNEECGMAFSNFMESAFGIGIPHQLSSIGWGHHHADHCSLRHARHRETELYIDSAPADRYAHRYNHGGKDLRSGFTEQ